MNAESIQPKEDLTLAISSRRYLLRRLETLAASMEKAVEKERAARQKKIEEMSFYKTYADAEDAYGMGDITAKEYDEIRDFLEQGETFVRDTKTVKSEALAMLRDYLSALHEETRDLEWDAKSPEEQSRILQANERFFKNRTGGI